MSCLPEPSPPVAAERPRTLLLVDDEANILASLRRLLRGDGYTILTAPGGPEGLAVLAQHPVDVVVSDQRMPQMTGVEFLRQAKERFPDTVRIVLSGYTDLKSVTDAINEGAIYKFLTKPWDDAMLRANIDEAFRRKALGDENRRLALELREANERLMDANTRLEALASRQRHRISLDERTLGLAQEILASLPVAVLGLDGEGLVVFANQAAQLLFDDCSPLIGVPAAERLPAQVCAGTGMLQHGGRCYRILARQLGEGEALRGRLVSLVETEEDGV